MASSTKKRDWGRRRIVERERGRVLRSATLLLTVWFAFKVLAASFFPQGDAANLAAAGSRAAKRSFFFGHFPISNLNWVMAIRLNKSGFLTIPGASTKA